MVRVVVPYTVRHPQVAAGVPADAEWVEVGGDDHAYWRLMRDLWADGESFLVVEHDVVCRPDVLVSFDECDHDWCLFPYDNICHWECMEAWANMLGCTRFSSRLLAAVPDAVSSIPDGLRDWHNLCDSIAGDKVGGMPAPLRPGSLRAAGFTHHWHHPGVAHHAWEGWRSVAEEREARPVTVEELRGLLNR